MKTTFVTVSSNELQLLLGLIDQRCQESEQHGMTEHPAFQLREKITYAIERVKSEPKAAPDGKILGYVLTRGDDATWMYAGTTPDSVANTVVAEIESNEGLGCDEIDEMHIEAREFTQKEIDEMPDFPGW